MVSLAMGQGLKYNNFMDKKGPRKLVTEAVKIGTYGNTKWHLQLECGHSLDSQRKPKINETKLSCKACLNPVSTEIATIPVDLGEELDPLSELKIRAAIASHFDVQIEQVDFAWGTATVFLDAQQVKRISNQ